MKKSSESRENSGRMKILFLIDQLEGFGGTEHHLSRLRLLKGLGPLEIPEPHPTDPVKLAEVPIGRSALKQLFLPETPSAPEWRASTEFRENKRTASFTAKSRGR